MARLDDLVFGRNEAMLTPSRPRGSITGRAGFTPFSDGNGRWSSYASQTFGLSVTAERSSSGPEETIGSKSFMGQKKRTYLI